ncbi:peptidase C14 [Fischerella sp. NIES-3754]|nr:peptidase C14 [Fischerella sp. NIES-3754]BCX09708.1 MAG: hypothetical protein KatS3mg066_3567 [Fischerella sp.]
MSRDALVVGIHTYSYERLSNLTAPVQDVEAISKSIRKAVCLISTDENSYPVAVSGELPISSKKISGNS